MTAIPRRRWLQLVAGVSVLGACGRVAPERGQRLQNGALLPTAALTDLDGNQVELSAMRGDPIVINFWASWCGPCRLEMPDFDRVWLSGDYPDMGLLAVNVAEGPFVAAQFAAELSLQIPLALADRYAAANLLGTASLPVTVFADADQIVRHIRYGALNEAVLRAQIEETTR